MNENEIPHTAHGCQEYIRFAKKEIERCNKKMIELGKMIFLCENRLTKIEQEAPIVSEHV